MTKLFEELGCSKEIREEVLLMPAKASRHLGLRCCHHSTLLAGVPIQDSTLSDLLWQLEGLQRNGGECRGAEVKGFSGHYFLRKMSSTLAQRYGRRYVLFAGHWVRQRARWPETGGQLFPWAFCVPEACFH